jgi:hypothetical protein
MGFLDKVKENASKVAGDAGRATKVAQAQLKVRSLQGDIEGVKKEIGGVAYDLIEKGELINPAFDELIAKIRDIQVQIGEKEAEIASLRADDSGDASATATSSQSDASEQ